MGYYDHDKETEDSPKRSKRGGGRGGWFFAGFLGAIIGVLATVFILPALGITNDSPGVTSNPQSDQVQNSGSNVNKTVNVSVNSAATKAVDKVSDAVVNVINYQNANFFDQQSQPTGMGAGVIYKKQNGKAYIVTNNHVIDGANRVEVGFDEDTKVPASIVGTDPLMDLAVLSIKADKVKGVAEFGNSSDLKRGEPVIAIGNPLGLSGSVTQGVVSSTNRTVPRDTNNDGQPDWQAEVIQTDAAINPGNSGGALVNLEGQVIGINSLKIAQQSVSDIGFAIPINIAEPIIQELEKYGKVTRPYIGIYYQPLSDFPEDYQKQLFILPDNVNAGIVVRSVTKGGPAQQAGIKQQDVITAINDKQINNAIDFRQYLFQQTKPDDTVSFTLYRNGNKQTVKVTLGKTQ